MSNLSPFLVLFDYSDIKITEQFDELKILLLSNRPKKLESPAFGTALAFLNSRDKLHLSFIVDNGDSTDFYTGDNEEEFLSELDGKLSVVEEENVVITIRVIKEMLDGVLSLYSYSDFLNFLKGLTIQAILYEFNAHIQKDNLLVFENQTTEPVSKTKSIWFVNKNFSGLPEKIDRTSLINRAKTACHYNLLAKSVLLAEDFLPIISDSPDLEDLLRRLSIVLSIIFLYDITTIQDSNLEYRLNGYKSISGNADLTLIKADPDSQYYKIYNWVYDSGNFVDKIGLARNIISLHLEHANKTELKGDPFRSIQSSYKVYEKQNIKQYIEIRNKISDQLLSFHDRANKIIETFASGFQKSALALITFYLSAILLKVINKDKLIEIFTIDAAILSTAFILCSVVYYFVLKWEVNAQRIRFERNYADVKKRYTDLLDEQDISRILNNDDEFKSDLKFIKAKGENYTIMWFIVLAIFFISTWLIYFIYNHELIFRMGIWLQKISS